MEQAAMECVAPASTTSTLEFESNTNRSFESLRNSVSEQTMSAIEAMNFTTMTEIQSKSIPKLLNGHDLRGTAKTGSGKTLAFLIPVVELLHKLNFGPTSGTGAIILSPTRELSMQIYGVLRELTKKHSQTHCLVIGGTNRKSESEKLGMGVNILVATPGRLLDHLKNTTNFVFKNCVALVIDEADRLLDAGFEKDIKAILRLLPERHQTMLFSATKDARTNDLVQLALKNDAMEVDVDSDKLQATVEGLEQAFVVCPADKRFLVLYSFIKKHHKKKVMVFFSSCKAVKFYGELLNYKNIPVLCLHGRQNQNNRTSAFYEFNKSESGILLCTDVAARGWDIPAVDWIVQYDPPNDPKDYIHRVGRTARAGGKGHALLFLTDEEMGFIRYLKDQKVNVDQMDITWSEEANLQSELEKLMVQNCVLHISATKAFIGYIRAYKCHSLKTVFDIGKIDLLKVAKCFGLTVPPFVKLGKKKKPKNKKKSEKKCH